MELLRTITTDVLAASAAAPLEQQPACKTRPRTSGPSPAEILAAKIEHDILRVTRAAVRGLVVSVTPRSVTLSGRCSSYYQKQLAQHAALPLVGDTPLVNEIEVG